MSFSKLLLLSLILCAATPSEAAKKWRPIFDGRSLSGWVPKITGQPLGQDPRRTFSVKNKAIRVSYDKYQSFGGQFGHLVYQRPVGAFRLRFQYRFYGNYLPDVEAWQHSNSGLMFHGQSPGSMTLDQKFPVSLELQLLGADGPEARPTGNLCTPGTIVTMAGRQVTEHCTSSESPTFPNGEWVNVEVEAHKDGQVTHRINGKAVLQYGDPELDPQDADAKPLIAHAGGQLAVRGGYLSLQSEGHPVEFRRIELMQLD